MQEIRWRTYGPGMVSMWLTGGLVELLSIETSIGFCSRVWNPTHAKELVGAGRYGMDDERVAKAAIYRERGRDARTG